MGHLLLIAYQLLTLRSLHLEQYRYFTNQPNVPGIYITDQPNLPKADSVGCQSLFVNAEARHDKSEYTREELIVLAELRRRSGRTCESCAWYVLRGRQRGCFPERRYRKWLSAEEFSSGCNVFTAKNKNG